MLSQAPPDAAVLRLQPERGIFEPYDVLREGEVLRRLGETAVPVPRVLAAESNPRFLGAPALLIEWVDAPHIGAPEADLDAFAAHLDAFTEALVTIHALDWRAAGLDFLGAPASPAAAFSAEVEIVARRMRAFGCQDEPLLTQAFATLRAATPQGGHLALCQGDPNPFNYLISSGKVVAVVDWEQARISDPRFDVGQLGALAHLMGAPFGPASDMPFLQMYEAAVGGTLGGMQLFRAFWLFQLAVVYHGWKQFNAIEPWYSWAQVRDLLSLALAEL